MSDKFTARQRRSRKLRSKTKEMSNHRLSIFRSNNQIYAQVFSPDGKEVLAHASSADKEAKLDKGGNQEAAKKVGELVAKRAIEKALKRLRLICLLYTSPSPRDRVLSRMPSSA